MLARLLCGAWTEPVISSLRTQDSSRLDRSRPVYQGCVFWLAQVVTSVDDYWEGSEGMRGLLTGIRPSFPPPAGLCFPVSQARTCGDSVSSRGLNFEWFVGISDCHCQVSLLRTQLHGGASLESPPKCLTKWPVYRGGLIREADVHLFVKLFTGRYTCLITNSVVWSLRSVIYCI